MALALTPPGGGQEPPLRASSGHGLIPKEKIGVVGAGLMGAEIALVHAMAGHEVLLNDRSDALLAAARARLEDLLAKGVPRGFWRDDAVAPTLARIATTTDLARFADRDAVIEAVFESEPVKAEVWKRLDTVCPAHCLFATNTSSIAISTLASYVGPARRAHFIGTHYFSPVSRMKLVEIIPAFDTAEDAVALATRLARDAGKTPIRVKDVVGSRRQPRAVGLLHRGGEAGRGGRGDAGGHRSRLPSRPRLHPVGPFELMDNCDCSSLAARGAGDPVRGLWRALPPAGADETDGQGRPRRPQGRTGLAQEARLARRFRGGVEAGDVALAGGAGEAVLAEAAG